MTELHAPIPTDVLGSEESEKSYPYDAIIVLGANMELDPETGEPRFPTIMQQRTRDGEADLIVAGKSRAIAAGQAFRSELSDRFIVVGGTQKDMPISNSSALGKLMVQYGVPEKNTEILEGNKDQNNTMSNAEMVHGYLKDHPEIRKIGIMTNKWHMERALMMWNNGDFDELGVSFNPVVVEEQLEQLSPHFKRWERKVDATQAMADRIAAEQQGIEDLKRGKYQK